MTTATTGVSIQRQPELLGQTVVVIGGSAGIGLETARRARAEGASIILTGRNPDRLKQAALELTRVSPKDYRDKCFTWLKGLLVRFSGSAASVVAGFASQAALLHATRAAPVRRQGDDRNASRR
jgi:NAD(P)-dependent dehydrogenase (short-subunit alcohol dehydrogenase family)